MGGFVDFLRMVLGWKSGSGAAPVASGQLCFDFTVNPSLGFSASLDPSIDFGATVRPSTDFGIEIGCND